MPPPRRPSSTTRRAELPAHKVAAALRQRAERIQQGAAPSTLRGRHVALMCASPADPSAQALAAAAAQLGARVSWLQPAGLAGGELQPGWDDTCRALAALYDLIGCVGMAQATVASLARGTGRPVVTDVCAPDHLAWRVSRQMVQAQTQVQAQAGSAGVSSAAARQAQAHHAVVQALLANHFD